MQKCKSRNPEFSFFPKRNLGNCKLKVLYYWANNVAQLTCHPFRSWSWRNSWRKLRLKSPVDGPACRRVAPLSTGAEWGKRCKGGNVLRLEQTWRKTCSVSLPKCYHGRCGVKEKGIRQYLPHLRRIRLKSKKQNQHSSDSAISVNIKQKLQTWRYFSESLFCYGHHVCGVGSIVAACNRFRSKVPNLVRSFPGSQILKFPFA